MSTSFFIILGTVLWIAFAFWPAILAKRKGYSFIVFLVLSWFVSFFVTLFVVFLLKDKTVTSADRAADKAADAALAKEENRI
jgi:ABC-type Mn2+/Zn2+ transport system permease subunit